MTCQETTCVALRREMDDAWAHLGEVAHCEADGCHQFYLLDYGGVFCAHCCRGACSQCARDRQRGCLLGDEDEWYCRACRDALLQNGTLRRCHYDTVVQCGGYAYSSERPCATCTMVVCDQCWALLFDNDGARCPACVARDAK